MLFFSSVFMHNRKFVINKTSTMKNNFFLKKKIVLVLCRNPPVFEILIGGKMILQSNHHTLNHLVFLLILFKLSPAV